MLRSITKNCETLFHQIQTAPDEKLEFKLIKPRETFHFNPPIQVEDDCMLGMTSLEDYNSNFNISEESNKFDFCTDAFDSDFSVTEVEGKVAEVLGLSDITIEDLEHEIYRPNFIKTCRKLSTEKSQTDGYYILLLTYMPSSFRDFESYPIILSSLDENDIQLILKQYKSKVTTYKTPPGVYTFKNFSEVFSRGFTNEFQLRKLQPKHKHDTSDSIIIESDNVTLITKLILRYKIKVLRFDKKSFFRTILGFSPYWDHKRLIGHDNEYHIEKKTDIKI